ncbi:hypothetical protein CH333_00265 [candidate division WOR-3 bacterium JGI_Cruoil_03_44_89]|uniref:Glycosyl transferase family 1 domain-containing protein n=1 Tax=candidate division WOR-3 bacterium JGI_Cruoil_03_44_89 TaxID=1973748 RepID=A0A235BZH3_UNCW3|nr:MAG: hypothetical protein CH333_00265 [candidate division WOR-3 bacterium JGI_Cruoil_03_44_89]
MRICFFADLKNIHTFRWLRYFAQKGYETSLITAATYNHDEIEGVSIYKIPYFHSFDTILLNFGYIKWLIYKIKPDILHGITLTSCAFYASLTGFHPFVATALGSDVLVNPQKSLRARKKLRYTLKKADFVTADADIVKRKIIDMYYPATKIKKVLFGVDSSLLLNRKKDGNSLILSYRSLKPNYNIDIIIEAYKLVKKVLPSSRLVVVGDTSQNPKLLYKDENIEFLPSMPHNKIIDYMTNFDIFVSVPSSDASSVSLLEAMALGLFPIVSDIPANREWIKNEYNGYLVSPRDVHKLADSIIKAIRQSALRESVARINKEIVREKAIFEDNMQKLEEIYHNLVK